MHSGPNPKPPLALIAGPTASGKSDVAVELALHLERQGKRAVIVNADSAQVYADLSVLSARPTEAEMRGIVHRLFGTWDGAKPCSAADWARAARAEIEAVQHDGGLPILVGGTGLYLQTLIEGIAPIPDIDPEIRRKVRALPTPKAYAALERADPERAALLSANDSTRISRALEVAWSTGKPLAHWQERREGGIGEGVTLHPAILMPEREALYARCDARFARMLDNGAIDEVTALLARNYDPALPVMRAIGVPEIAGHFSGKLSLDEVREAGARATRQYAKRQFTWLRNQPPDEWPRIETMNFNPVSTVEIILQYWRLT